MPHYPASSLYKSIAGRYRPVSYPDGPRTARYRFIKNPYRVSVSIYSSSDIWVGWILRNCWRVRDTNMAGFYVRMCLVSSWWSFSANGIWRNYPSGEAANSAVSLVVSCLQVPRGTFSQDKTSQRWVSAKFFVCLCWGFTAQSTQWGHVERGQFT